MQFYITGNCAHRSIASIMLSTCHQKLVLMSLLRFFGIQEEKSDSTVDVQGKRVAKQAKKI